MKTDYRNTKYCSKLDSLAEKKRKLNEEVYEAHPKVKIIYNQIKDNKGIYKSRFIEIYNYKCSYCGNSILNISSNLFEVDHYICESSFNSKEDAGKIENLVLACYDCNRAKSGFLIEESYSQLLNPDLESITDIFFRDDMYYIKIVDKYKDDKFVKLYYNQLKFGYQSRRLDFLLMNIRGMSKKAEGSPRYEKLNAIISKLQYKRNLTSCKLL